MPKKSRAQRIPQDIVTATVTQLSHEGRGITQCDGKTTFLFGALPNETVQFKYLRCHRQYDEGQVIAVDNASSERVVPRCTHFDNCGGCSLQHLSQQAQIQHKQNVLLEHLEHQANCKPKITAAPIQGPQWGYRRKARLSVRDVHKKNKVLVGFRERNGRFVTDISSCEVLHPSVGEKIELLSQLLMSLETKSDIPQIEVAVGDNATVIIIRHLQPLPATDLEKLISFSKDHHLRLYLQPKGPESIYAASPDTINEPLYYDIPAYNIRMPFEPTQFTQVNQDINLKMLDQAIDWLALQPTDHVLDLFCGIGNFSLPIAKKCQHVVGVEGSSSSIEQAIHNAKLNQISNADFYTHDLTLPVTLTPWHKKHFDKILLDPPRAGAKELMPIIKQWSPSRIVYVSCNPITLARDTKYLLDLGYRLEKAGVMDMFPHTQHVEAMALFYRQ